MSPVISIFKHFYSGLLVLVTYFRTSETKCYIFSRIRSPHVN